MTNVSVYLYFFCLSVCQSFYLLYNVLTQVCFFCLSVCPNGPSVQKINNIKSIYLLYLSISVCLCYALLYNSIIIQSYQSFYRL